MSNKFSGNFRSWLPFYILFLLISCGVNINSLIPAKLGNGDEALLINRQEGPEALKTIRQSPEHAALLNEFNPEDQSCGIYNYSGIKIILSIIKFKDADQAYGFLSGLTYRPRQLFRMGDDSLITYKEPYFAGVKGRYAFTFYSPTNPGNYAPFYKSGSEKIISKIKTGTEPDDRRSYHYKFLPESNRFADSVFYTKDRTAGRLVLQNAYAAEYVAKRKNIFLYIERYRTRDKAQDNHNFRAEQMLNEKISLSDFVMVYPGKGFSWQDQSGINVIYTYNRFSIIIKGIPEIEYAHRFIKNIFINMSSIKQEVLEEEKKTHQ